MSRTKTVPLPPHCGGCDPRTRTYEDEETRLPRLCRNCHPRTAVPAQKTYRAPDIEVPVDSGWMVEARRAITYLAEQRVPFAAEDVADLGIGEPDHPNHWGVAFQSASREGIIAAVSVGPSPRETRRGGLRRMWVGRLP